MTSLRAGSAVGWLPWSAAAFDRAREEQKCVLLSVTAPWSAACREMDRRCYGDPDIVAEVNRWFIPVRVDADRRPDVAERYDLGGLPTTAFLNASGEILGGGTLVPPERLIEALRHASRPRSSHAVPSAPPHEEPIPGTPLSDDDLVSIVFHGFDHVHGGFGGAPKFPLVAPVRLALYLSRDTGSDELTTCATRTLDAMAFNGLYDEEGGGFCRCALHADWSEPQPEKLLAVNAALLDLYLEAGELTGNQRWLARAADVLDFVQGALSLGPGQGWRAAVESDGAKMADANAAMVSAMLRAARAFGDDSLRELALQSLEAVLLETYRPGRGVAHCAGSVRGLLTDHVAFAAAHLDAWDMTGDVVYQMMAEELTQFMVRTLLTDHGFADRATLDGDEPVGLLAQAEHPFVLNCDAANVLRRLGRATGTARWLELADQILAAIAPRAALHGPLAAHFVLAQRARRAAGR